MKNFQVMLFLMLLSVAFVASAMAENPAGDAPKYRAFWVNAFQPSLHTPEGVAKVVQVARDYNYNTIIAEVRLQCDAFYDSKVEPKSPKVQPADYDPLADIIKLAHDTSDGKQRLEVQAWIVTYRANLNMSSNPIAEGGPEHVLSAHPGWVNTNFKGETTTGGRQYLDPGIPGVLDHTVAVVKDIVSRYDVDGIHWDYLRYPEEATSGACDWGYNPISVSRFNHIHNRKGNPETNDPLWSDFRRQQVLDLTRKTYVEAKKIDPKVKMVASTVNWGAYGGDFKKTGPYVRTMQDWVTMMEQGYLDGNFIMNYKREFDESQKKDYRQWSTLVGETKAGRYGVIGQGAYMNESKDTIAQMTSDFANPALDGIATYCYSEPRADANPSQIPDQTFFPMVKEELFYEKVDVPAADWLENPTEAIVSGYVKIGDKAADFAELTLQPSGKKTHTDGTGFYAFTRVEPGEYTITAKPIDVEASIAKVKAVAGKIASEDFVCKP